MASLRWIYRGIVKAYGFYRQLIRICLVPFVALGSGIIRCLKKPVALALVLIVPLLVIAGHRLAGDRVAARCPEHMQEIIDEISSIQKLRLTEKPVINHSDTKLLYQQFTTNDSSGIYMLDIASESSALVRDAGKKKGSKKKDGSVVTAKPKKLSILGWSPDDKYFAFTSHSKVHDDDELVVCDGISGKEVAQLYFTNPIISFVWPASQKLLVSDGNRVDELSIFPGHFKKAAFYSPKIAAPKSVSPNLEAVVAGKIESLQSFGSNSIVCKVSNSICLCTKGQPLKPIWQATNANLLTFTVFEATGKFLLQCEDINGQFLAYFTPAVLPDNQGEWVVKNEMTDIVRLDASEYRLRQMAWINNGEGYAHLDYSDNSLNRLVIKPSAKSAPFQLPMDDVTQGFSVGGNHLYTIAASTNEAGGIWRYDLVTGEMQCVVSSMGKSFKYATILPMLKGQVTNAAGERLTYYLSPPADSASGRKHPLVIAIRGIAEKGYTWDVFAQTVSSCGGYVVCLDRRNRDANQWADDALCAYKYLVKKSDIDADRVFLFGVSAGAYSCEQLLKSNPELWKGAFFLSMSIFPDPAALQVPFVSLDVGGDDEGVKINQLLDSQDKLAAAGVRPLLVLHPGVGHLVRTAALQKERMKALAAFLQQP
jgi:predicted esterase